MISTYLSYRSYTADLPKTLAPVASEAQISRDAQYYKDNIGKVKSVDDFIDNTRLFSYAMKAYGLEDMTYAKAFMRKVLESDVNDSKSFVGKLHRSALHDFREGLQLLDGRHGHHFACGGSRDRRTKTIPSASIRTSASSKGRRRRMKPRIIKTTSGRCTLSMSCFPVRSF